MKQYKEINFMKYLLIISCLLFINPGWSKDISWYDLEERDGLYYEKVKNILFTGDITGRENGKIIKGKREGEWLEYWDNGQLYSRTNYQGGKYDGAYFSYYDSGQLNVNVHYINGKKDHRIHNEELPTYLESIIRNKAKAEEQKDKVL